MNRKWIPNPRRRPAHPAAFAQFGAPGAPAVSARRLRKGAESFLAYAVRFPTAKNSPLDFSQYPFQRQIYEVFGDPSVQEATAMKSVQVGMSELLARLTFYYADIHGLTALYVFPALTHMQDFSDARVNGIRENSSYLRSRTKLGPASTWNKGLKRIGGGHVYYRGSEAKNQLLAIDADLVVLDEYDSLHPPNIPEAERRISGSQLGLLRRVGVPSDSEYGIAKKYAQSDRRTWMVKCTRCKCGWQQLDFWKNVRWDTGEDGLVENPAVVCHGCQKPLNVLRGQWVAERPNRDRPGFHVHRLMNPDPRNLRTVIESSMKREPHLVKSFHNSDLGLPFTDKTGGLDRARSPPPSQPAVPTRYPAPTKARTS